MRVSKIAGIMMIGLMASYAHGQQIGLPVATDASRVVGGTFDVSGGIVLGDDVNFYGGRFNFNVTDELSVFGDLGLIDIDRLDMGYGAQGGVLFRLPEFPDIPLDFGVRGTLGYGMVSDDFDVDYLTLSALGLASYTIDEMFSVYGVLGLAYVRQEISGRVEGFSVSATDSETDPAIGVGVQVKFMPEMSAYVEFIHIDDPWIGLGAKFKF